MTDINRKNDEQYMKRCLELAALGRPFVRANPMVGSILVYNNRVIGEGFHQYFGGTHAEVNAINSVKDKDLISKSILYVNLEPCSHHGKTPPCADFIVKMNIPKVVIGTVDHSSKVSGRGIKVMEDAGIEVKIGVLEEECWWLNRIFFTFHEKKRPYVILKWAQSSDGFIDKKRSKTDPIGPNWISNDNCRILVHKWRSEIQAIMVGTNTIEKDNPTLNTRLWPGADPSRVVPDRENRLEKNLNVFNSQIPTIVFSNRTGIDNKNLEFVMLREGDDMIKTILNELYRREYSSLFVEGGQALLSSFIKERIWDEARIFTGDMLFREGIAAPRINAFVDHEETMFDKTRLEILYNM